MTLEWASWPFSILHCQSIHAEITNGKNIYNSTHLFHLPCMPECTSWTMTALVWGALVLTFCRIISNRSWRGGGPRPPMSSPKHNYGWAASTRQGEHTLFPCKTHRWHTLHSISTSRPLGLGSSLWSQGGWPIVRVRHFCWSEPWPSQSLWFVLPTYNGKDWA